MQALGTDLVLVCSNSLPAAIDDDARAAADLAEMAARAATRGLRVGYEALAWGRHVNRCIFTWNIVQRANHAALGLIVDSFHTLAVNDDPAGIADVPADKLFFVQLADAPRLAMDSYWSRHFHNFPRQGHCRWMISCARCWRRAIRGRYRWRYSMMNSVLRRRA